MILVCEHDTEKIDANITKNTASGGCAVCYSWLHNPDLRKHYENVVLVKIDKPAVSKPCCGKSLVTKAASATKSFAYWTGQAFRKPTSEQLASRETICLSCDKHDPKNDQCKECGCYLKKVFPIVGDVGKRNHAGESCPLKLWDAV